MYGILDALFFTNHSVQLFIGQFAVVGQLKQSYHVRVLITRMITDRNGSGPITIMFS